jgi:hypothetical protein
MLLRGNETGGRGSATGEERASSTSIIGRMRDYTSLLFHVSLLSNSNRLVPFISTSLPLRNHCVTSAWLNGESSTSSLPIRKEYSHAEPLQTG